MSHDGGRSSNRREAQAKGVGTALRAGWMQAQVALGASARAAHIGSGGGRWGSRGRRQTRWMSGDGGAEN